MVANFNLYFFVSDFYNFKMVLSILGTQFIQYDFIILISLHQFIPDNPLSPYPLLIFFFLPIKSNLCWPINLGINEIWWDITWSHISDPGGDISGTILLMKIDFSSPRVIKCQLLLSKGWDSELISSSPFWNVVRLQFKWVLCMLSLSLGAHMCIFTVMSRKDCVLEVIHHVWVFISFLLSLSHTAPKLEERRVINSSQLGPKIEVFYSLYVDQLWISMLTVIYFKKVPWWELGDELIYGYTNKPLRIILTLFSFTRIIVVSFLWGPWLI